MIDDLDVDEPVTKPVPIPVDLRLALKNVSKKTVFLHARAKLRGVVYARSETHEGNSLVLFYPNGDRSSKPIPGCIKYIYSLDGHHYSFAVRRQLQPGQVRDAYALYPYFPAEVYSTQFSESLEVVRGDWIFCHYARWQFSSEHVVVLNLSRVCLFLCFPL